jgi:hypothetical protein
MEVKNIFSALSENVNDVKYSSILYKNSREKFLLFSAIIIYGIYLILISFCPLLSLIFATLFLILTLAYSASSFIGSKGFIMNPVLFYVSTLNDNIDNENIRMEKLSRFSHSALFEANKMLKFENKSLQSNISFIAGAIDKVGIFPSLLALFYAYHEYNSLTGSTLPALIILGLVMGFYFGLYLIQRIINWQNYGIYLLNKALNLKIDS